MADATYPAPAPIPHGIRRRVFDHLVSVGIVDPAKGGRFRMHGLAAERGRRSKRGADAANERWERARIANALQADSASNAGASAEDMHSEPLRAETRRTEPTRSDARATNGGAPTDDEFALQALAEELTQQPYALANLRSRLGETAVRQVAVHGLAATEAAWREVAADAGGTPTLRQLVLGADDRLDPIPQAPRLTAKERKEAELDEARRWLREGSGAR